MDIKKNDVSKTRKFFFAEKEPSKFSMIFSQKLQENRNNGSIEKVGQMSFISLMICLNFS
jgi:hypothetical protein